MVLFQAPHSAIALEAKHENYLVHIALSYSPPTPSPPTMSLTHHSRAAASNSPRKLSRSATLWAYPRVCGVCSRKPFLIGSTSPEKNVFLSGILLLFSFGHSHLKHQRIKTSRLEVIIWAKLLQCMCAVRKDMVVLDVIPGIQFFIFMFIFKV